MARRWTKIGSGIALGVTTVLGLFLLLQSNFGFIITDLTGDISCEGTYENPCISEFSVKNPTRYDVDIYSKENIKLDFSPNIKDYALFTKDGRCSATGVCACELKNGEMLGFKGWRCVDFTNKTKPIETLKYTFRFPKYSTKNFLLAGIKNNPQDKIKWGFGAEDSYLDPIWNPQSRISIQNTTEKWNIIKYDSIEKQDWKVDIRKTEICLIPKNKLTKNDKKVNDLKLETKDKTDKIIKDKIIKDKKDSQIIKEDKGEVTEICYIPESTEDWVKFGNNSIVLVYEETSTVLFSISDNANITATLYKDINGDGTDWNNTINDVFVYFNQDKWKFGGNDSYNTGWEKYKYVLSSDAKLEKINNNYYFRDGLGGYKVDTSDICNKYLSNETIYDNETGYNVDVIQETANCSFNTYTTSHEETSEEGNYTIIDKYFLEIEFYSDSEIDPSYTFENLESDTYLENVRFEGDNSTHLEISTNSPYDSLVLYMPFDVNKSQTTTYDYTNNNNDGTVNGDAHYVDEGVYGGAFEFDGNGDYIEEDTKLVSSYPFTLSSWSSISEFSAIAEHTIVSMADKDDIDILYGLRYYHGEVCIAVRNPNFFASCLPVNVTEWNNVVGVFLSDNDKRLYVNGINVVNLTTNISYSSAVDRFSIGRWGDSTPGGYFNGLIDEVMIFNTSLNSSQILQLYNNQSSRFVNSGTESFSQQNITGDRINLSIDSFKNNKSSNLTAKIGYWNSSYGYNVSDVGLVGYWTFDGNATDISGNGNDGTVNGDIQNTSGVYDGAYEFDGVNDDIDVNLPDWYGNDWSWSCWVKTNDNEHSQMIIQHGSGWNGNGAYMNIYAPSGARNIYITVNNDQAVDSSDFPENIWQFIVATKSGTNLSLYRNGLLVNSVVSDSGSAPTGNMHIGNSSASTDNFNGSIDEVMIYNRSLSETEIKELYIKGKAKWNYTEPQTIETENTNYTFSIESNMTNIYPELTYNAGTYDFYTPILEGSISLDTYYSGGEVIPADVSLNYSFVLEDVYIDENDPSTNKNGELLQVSNGSGDSTTESLIKFDISSLDNTEINSAILYLDLKSNNLDSSAEGYNISIHHLYDSYSWIETEVGWVNKPSTSYYNQSYSDIKYFFGGTGEPKGVQAFDVTDILNAQKGDDNVSFFLKVHDIVGTPSALTDRLIFMDSEDSYSEGGLRPMLNITYGVSINIVSPVYGEHFNQDNPTTIFNITTSESTEECFWSDDDGKNYTLNRDSSKNYSLENYSMVDGGHNIYFYCQLSSDDSWIISDLTTSFVDSLNVTVKRDLLIQRKYELLNNITGHSQIDNNNIILDLNGFSFFNDSDGSFAISITFQDNITLLDGNLNMSADDLSVVFSDVNLINISYPNREIEDLTVGFLYRKWYFESLISSGGSLENANVSVYDKNLNIILSKLTDSNGKIGLNILEEYNNSDGTYVYQTPYSINVSKDGYYDNLTLINLSILKNYIHEVNLISTTPTDSCTYLSGDWDVDCSDNCFITSDVDILGDLILKGSGTFSFNSNLDFISSNQKIIHGSGCKIIQKTGGKIS